MDEHIHLWKHLTFGPGRHKTRSNTFIWVAIARSRGLAKSITLDGHLGLSCEDLLEILRFLPELQTLDLVDWRMNSQNLILAMAKLRPIDKFNPPPIKRLQMASSDHLLIRLFASLFRNTLQELSVGSPPGHVPDKYRLPAQKIETFDLEGGKYPRLKQLNFSQYYRPRMLYYAETPNLTSVTTPCIRSWGGWRIEPPHLQPTIRAVRLTENHQPTDIIRISKLCANLRHLWVIRGLYSLMDSDGWDELEVMPGLRTLIFDVPSLTSPLWPVDNELSLRGLAQLAVAAADTLVSVTVPHLRELENWMAAATERYMLNRWVQIEHLSIVVFSRTGDPASVRDEGERAAIRKLLSKDNFPKLWSVRLCVPCPLLESVATLLEEIGVRRIISGTIQGTYSGLVEDLKKRGVSLVECYYGCDIVATDDDVPPCWTDRSLNHVEFFPVDHDDAVFFKDISPSVKALKESLATMQASS